MAPATGALDTCTPQASLSFLVSAVATVPATTIRCLEARKLLQIKGKRGKMTLMGSKVLMASLTGTVPAGGMLDMRRLTVNRLLKGGPGDSGRSHIWLF